MSSISLDHVLEHAPEPAAKRVKLTPDDEVGLLQ